MNKEEQVFKYGSQWLRMGTKSLICGIVGFLISFLFPNIPFFAGFGFGIGVGGLYGAVLLYSLHLIYYLIFQVRYNRYSKIYNLNSVRSEMLEHSTKRCRGTYFTRNYIVNYVGNYLFICKYNELMWIYVHVRRVVGLVGKNKIQQIIAYNADYDTLDEVLELILPHNSNILVGFTKENKKAYKKLLRESKK